MSALSDVTGVRPDVQVWKGYNKIVRFKKYRWILVSTDTYRKKKYQIDAKVPGIYMVSATQRFKYFNCWINFEYVLLMLNVEVC